MEFEHLKAIIDFAIENEKVAAAFYDEVSEKEPFAGSKEMLKEFAAEERKHQALLEKFLTEGVDTSVAEYKLEWITDIKRSNYVVEMEYEEGMGYNELLMLAMKREEKALALYNHLENQVDDAESKKLFQILAQEEAKHKLFLETKYDDYMAEMGD
jgi:rubrerythrin